MKLHEADDAEAAAEAVARDQAEAVAFSLGPPRKRRKKSEEAPLELTPTEIEKQKDLVEKGHRAYVVDLNLLIKKLTFLQVE